MTMEPCLPVETDLERIDGLLADLGTLNRRCGSESLTEADYLTLSRRMRVRLKALRASLIEAEEPPIELTEVGVGAAEAIAAAGRVGQDPAVQALLRRIPALMTAQQLAARPSVRRARFYGAFAAIDGGRP